MPTKINENDITELNTSEFFKRKKQPPGSFQKMIHK